ncbi:MAG TPA: DUF1801 domain-containing protein [Sphingomicrobium sp.]|nr:DUF1801 domain-containing protein [Sphingomicrobium sp.]
MAELKTRPTALSPADYISAIDSPRRREEAQVIDAMMRRVSGTEPRMWGPSIIGYGAYHYRYASGHEGDAPRIGFSPRKAQHVLYLMDCDGGDHPDFDALLERLGKHKTSKACLYVNKLADIDLAVLEQLSALSWQAINQRHPG